MGQAGVVSSVSDGVKNVVGSEASEKIDNLAEKARGAADAIGAQASDLADTAKDYAARGADALIDKVNEQKGAGAEYVSGVAEVLRRVASEFEPQVPFAAPYLRSAAEQVDNVADGLRSGDVSQLVRRAQTFAREQPTLVAGIALLAGFGVVRLIRNANAADDAPGGSSRR